MSKSSIKGLSGHFILTFNDHFYLPDALREIANAIENHACEEQLNYGDCSNGSWSITYDKDK